MNAKHTLVTFLRRQQKKTIKFAKSYYNSIHYSKLKEIWQQSWKNSLQRYLIGVQLGATMNLMMV